MRADADAVFTVYLAHCLQIFPLFFYGQSGEAPPIKGYLFCFVDIAPDKALRLFCNRLDSGFTRSADLVLITKDAGSRTPQIWDEKGIDQSFIRCANYLFLDEFHRARYIAGV